ncbi:hypothetical protein [Aliivibrio fischeri]|uniref:Uncharacterized protein n=1 Tax=Aliivibrio fischeri TaxID=668 RepID=A0A844P6E1_ALIFS|nr:hypothetical protein [Aliivibrio fischeri]MUK51592.1 hypothetical protein [Aliivibrio fischeri]
MIQTWESTTVNKVQMYLIVLIYLIAIPLTIKASRDNKQPTSITQRIRECYQKQN